MRRLAFEVISQSEANSIQSRIPGEKRRREREIIPSIISIRTNLMALKGDP
jgi:hypothetical protein